MYVLYIHSQLDPYFYSIYINELTNSHKQLKILSKIWSRHLRKYRTHHITILYIRDCFFNARYNYNIRADCSNSSISL